MFALIKIKDGLFEGLKAYYYVWSGEKPPDNLLDLEPVKEGVSPRIDYTWWDSPVKGLPREFYAIAWTGFIKIDKPGYYRFYVITDDGSRLWINEELIIDAWKDQPPTTYVSKPIYLSSGYCRVRYYYYNRYGLGRALLGWIPPHGKPETIPSENLYHSIGEEVFFTGLDTGYIVEVEQDKQVIKTCKAVNSICSIEIPYNEQPLEAHIRIRSGKDVIYETPEKILLWGGDELKLVEIDTNKYFA
ncbi:MAG: PA14 domain-containing protein [Thermoprotei archaeon]